MSDDDDDYEERDDEKPQVVQLKKGDLTELEALELTKGKKINCPRSMTQN